MGNGSRKVDDNAIGMHEIGGDLLADWLAGWLLAAVGNTIVDCTRDANERWVNERFAEGTIEDAEVEKSMWVLW